MALYSGTANAARLQRGECTAPHIDKSFPGCQFRIRDLVTRLNRIPPFYATRTYSEAEVRINVLPSPLPDGIWTILLPLCHAPLIRTDPGLLKL